MSDLLGWLPVVLAVLLVLGWYLSFSATRIDRLHHRVEAARAALETQLARRAAAALEVAPLLPPGPGTVLASAAGTALAADARPDVVDLRVRPAGAVRRGAAGTGGGDATGTGGEVLLLATPAVGTGVGAVVLDEEAQNVLTRALHTTFGDPAALPGLRDQPEGADLLAGLGRACARVQLARRFHNDAVAQAQRVRRKRVVRWARLAGHAAMPAMIEIDDSIPPALTG